MMFPKRKPFERSMVDPLNPKNPFGWVHPFSPNNPVNVARRNRERMRAMQPPPKPFKFK